MANIPLVEDLVSNKLAEQKAASYVSGQAPIGGDIPDPNKSKSGLILKIIVIVLAVLVVAGGASAGYFYYEKVSFEKAIDDAFAKFSNISSVNSLQYDLGVKIKGEAKSGASDKSITSFITSGFSSSTKGELIMTVNGAFQKKNDYVNIDNKINFNLTTDGPQNVKGELEFAFKQIDKVFYFVINKYPEVPMANDLLAKVKEQWVKIDIASLIKKYNLDRAIKEFQDSNPALASQIAANNAEKEKELETIMKSFKENNVFTLVGTTKEKVDGLEMYRYDLTLNKDNFKKFALAVYKELNKKEISESEIANLDKTLANIMKFDVSLFVNSKTHVLSKVIVNSNIQDMKTGSVGDVSAELKLSKYNENIDITVPEKFMELEKLIAIVYPQALPNDLDKDTDYDNVDDVVENWYGSDINKRDTDGDGYDDYDEIRNGYNPNGPGKMPQEKNKISVYFSNTKNNPNMIDCSKVEAVSRDITKSLNPFEKAFSYLVDGGPTEQEKLLGYMTSIDQTVQDIEPRVIRLSDGILYMDFNQGFEQTVGGSCRVGAIRAQIENTMKQFPGINSVVISVEGETEGVLQP